MCRVIKKKHTRSDFKTVIIQNEDNYLDVMYEQRIRNLTFMKKQIKTRYDEYHQRPKI